MFRTCVFSIPVILQNKTEQEQALNELRKETEMLIKSVDDMLVNERIERKKLRRQMGSLMVCRCSQIVVPTVIVGLTALFV